MSLPDRRNDQTTSPADTLVHQSEIQKGKLLRILGASFGIAVTLGGTIGVGILRTPGMVAAQLGDSLLIVGAWILGGAYALLATLAVIELGTMLPQAGGWYVYARRAFGEYGGFVVGWSDWIAQSAALAYLAIAMGEFSGMLFPNLSAATKVIAGSVLVLFAILHWMGLRMSSKAQEWTSLIKAIAFVALIVAAFGFGKAGNAPAAEGTAAVVPISSLLVAFIIALQSVIVTYDGWYTAVYFTEEDVDPGRNLPRAALGGVLATIIIYVLVNASFVYALPIAQLGSSTLPAAVIAQNIFGAHGGQIITALSLISLLSIVNAVLMMATRIMFALSRDRLFFGQAAIVNERGTPVVAMVLSTGAGIVLAVSGTFEELIAISAFFYVVIYTTGFLALFILRKREADLPRPFKVPGYPWTPLIVLIGSILFLIGALVSDTANSVYALVLIALSYPVYMIVKPRRPPEPH